LLILAKQQVTVQILHQQSVLFFSEYHSVSRYNNVDITSCKPTKYSLLRTDFHETNKGSRALCKYRQRISPKSVGKCGEKRKPAFCPKQIEDVAGPVGTRVRIDSQSLANKSAIQNLIKIGQTFLSQTFGHIQADGRTWSVPKASFHYFIQKT
jgi:hypothetical protein